MIVLLILVVLHVVHLDFCFFFAVYDICGRLLLSFKKAQTTATASK